MKAEELASTTQSRISGFDPRRGFSDHSSAYRDDTKHNNDRPHKDVATHRPNENKMSDGGRGRASLGMKVWNSSQKRSVQRSAVRSIARLRLSKKWECIVFLPRQTRRSLLSEFMPRFKPYDYRQELCCRSNSKPDFPRAASVRAPSPDRRTSARRLVRDPLRQRRDRSARLFTPAALKSHPARYARGIVGSRRLERACQENITFLALACGIRPDHSTLAAFVGKLQGRIELIFSEVLLVCHEEGLLRGTHLSLDGVKLPGNASRESSGTFEQLRFKAAKLRRKVTEQIAEHRRQDLLYRKRGDRTGQERAHKKERRARDNARLLAEAQRPQRSVAEEEPKEGARGQEVQSNATDNESAKMTTSHGVMQGYNAQALVDAKAQIIVHGRASGVGQDHAQIGPVLEGAREVLELAGLKDEVLVPGETILSADCNYHSEENLQACQKHKSMPTFPTTTSGSVMRVLPPRNATKPGSKKSYSPWKTSTMKRKATPFAAPKAKY